jgi:6-pyruvoyltetrahydropterin/6-carboxytetrahydropterin synthase
VSGEPDNSGIVAEFSEIKPAMRRCCLAAATHPSTRTRTAAEITQKNDSLSIICGRKRYQLPNEDVTVLPLINTTLEVLAGYLLSQVLPQLKKTGLVAAELEISELPGTSATARADLG